LWASVYEEDEEARGIWKKEIGLPDAKIREFGPEDNFCPRMRRKPARTAPVALLRIYVGETPGKGVEIWNSCSRVAVRPAGRGKLVPLAAENIDTAWALERTASVLQGVKSNFDIDTFREFRKN